MISEDLIDRFRTYNQCEEDIELINKASDGKIDFTIGSALDIFGGDLEFERVIKY